MKKNGVKLVVVISLLSATFGSQNLSAVSKEKLFETLGSEISIEGINLDLLTDKHLEIVGSLFPHKMDGLILRIIIGSLTKVPSDQLPAFSVAARSLFTKDMHKADLCTITKYLTIVPADHLQEFTDAAHSLFTPKMSGFSRRSIIASLIKIPADKLQAFTLAASSILTKEMGGGCDRNPIIESLTKVPADQLRGFTEAARSLFTLDMIEGVRKLIIESLTKVPIDQLQGFTDAAHSLFTPKMSGFSRRDIIASLTKVPADQLQGFTKTARSLFTTDMKGDHRSAIIKSFSKVSSLRLGPISEYIHQLKQRADIRENQHIISLIETLSQFDDDHRLEAFVNGVIRLCQRDTVAVDGNRLLTHMQTMQTRMSAMNQDEIRALVEYRQSTHKKEVHESIAFSLSKLMNRYPEAFKTGNVFSLMTQKLEDLPHDTKTDFEDSLTRLKAKYSSTSLPDLIDGLLEINPYTRAGGNNEDTLLNKRAREELTAYQGEEELRNDVTNVLSLYARLKDHEHALAALKFMEQTSSYRDASTQLTYSEMLSLIYAGINDPKGSMNGQLLSDKDREERWLTFRNRLAKARNEYGDSSASCTSGYFNAAIEALDGTHPDVHIIHSFKALMQEIALEKDDKIYDERINVALLHLGQGAENDSYYQEEIKIWRDAREFSKEDDPEDEEPNHKLGLSSLPHNEEDR